MTTTIKKIGIFVGLFVLVWSLLNLVPIIKTTKFDGPNNTKTAYCTLNYISCYSDFGDIDWKYYPKFLAHPSSWLLVGLILPIILTVLIYKILIKKMGGI